MKQMSTKTTTLEKLDIGQRFKFCLGNHPWFEFRGFFGGCCLLVNSRGQEISTRDQPWTVVEAEREMVAVSELVHGDVAISKDEERVYVRIGDETRAYTLDFKRRPVVPSESVNVVGSIAGEFQ